MITEAQRQAITDYVTTHHLSVGIGSQESACSIAAINLSLSGRLIDTIPNCMSSVIGKWIISVQDVMPDDMRNSDEWRLQLPDAAGTGRKNEADRLEIIMRWMWEDVLPLLLPIAQKYGFGDQWEKMLISKSSQAAHAAASAADAPARAARAAANAAYAARAADAAYAAYAARAADAAYAADDAAANAAASFWHKVNPCKVLRNLIECGCEK